MRRPARGEELCPGAIAGARPEHARLVDAPDSVPLQQEGEPGDVILVRVREHEDVHAPVPGRQALVERDQESTGIRSAVDDHPAAAAALDQDPVALADVQDDHARHAVGPMGDDQGQPQGRADESDDCDARCTGASAIAPVPAPRPSSRTGSRSPFRGLGSPRSRPLLQPRPPQSAHGRDDSIAPSRRRQDQPERCCRAQRVPWRRELHAREGDTRANAHGGDHRGIQRPSRQPHDRGDDRRHSETHGHPDDERQCPRRHRGRDERHDHQVHRGRHEREATELQQHDRRRGCLGRERDAEDLRDPAPQPARLRPGQSGSQRRAPREDSGRGQHGKTEPGVVHELGVDQEQDRAGPAKCGSGSAGAPELPREERHARHRAGSDDRGRRSDEDDVGEDRERGQSRSPATLQAARDRAEGRSNDRDVPTGDRDDVAGAGRRERSSEIPVDTIAEADQHARRETRLGLRDGSVDAVGGRSTKALQGRGDCPFDGQQLEGLGAERADGADSSQVRAIVVGRRRPDAAAKLDAVAGDDRRVPRQRGRDEHGRLPVEQDCRGTGAGSRRPDGLDDPDPRAVATRYGHRRERLARPKGHPKPDRDDAGAERQEPEATAVTSPGPHRCRGTDERDAEQGDG